MAIMDDIKLSISVRDIDCTAPRVFDAKLAQLDVEVCPGYSRSLRAKLPPSAPTTKRPRKPGILRYWEGTGSFSGLALRFAAPVTSRAFSEGAPGMSLPASVADSFAPKSSHVDSSRDPENGVFVRVDTVKVDAYGKAADERHEAMMRATLHVRSCSAGSTAVDALSHALYESMSTNSDAASKRARAGQEESSEDVESVENIDKIVAARPELLVWVEDVTAGVDVNCSKRHSMRVDIAGNGCIFAIEPVGLVLLVHYLLNFVAKYMQRPSRRAHSSSSLETDSLNSLVRTSSESSLQSYDEDASSLRFVCDFRHLTAMVLGHGPVGDGDTMGIVVSTRTLVIPLIDILGGSGTHVVGSTTYFTLMHWSQWARTTNLVCEKATFDVHRASGEGKKMSFKNMSVDWDLDCQSGLEALPGMLGTLKQLKQSARLPLHHELDGEDLPGGLPHLPSRGEIERAQLTDVERQERRERKRKKLIQSLSTWQLQGTNISVTASFPDGPKMGLSVGEFPAFTLDAKKFVGRNVVLTMLDRKCAYGAEFRMSSPLHSMNRSAEKRRIEIEVEGLRFMMWHDFQFGYLLQDWLLRLRSVMTISREARLRRQGIPLHKVKRRPLPDVYFSSSDVEIFFEDHPIGGFLTQMLPLYQDETRERLVREQLMGVRIQQLQRIAKAEIAGTAQRCMDALRKKDSGIWAARVKRLKEANPAKKVANGYLPDLEFAPVATFVAASLSFSLVMDDLVREQGSTESIRRLKMLDDYELGSKKHKKTRQYDSNAWNSIGFRMASLEAVGVRLRFRDYSVAFVVIDRMHFDRAIVGQAVQASVPPYVAETTVAVGRRRLVKVVKGLGPTKTFADIHLIIETLQCGYNPSFLGAIGDFAKGVGRFFGGGKNPSPRIPWFDTLRVNMHGQMRITAKKLRGHLTSSISPYSMTKHYAEVDADNFEMLASRLETNKEDPFPISWKLYNWRIRPSSFDNESKSEIVFDFVRVGLNPVISVLSGDPQDHYFVPFPSKEDIDVGGPGIGKGSASLVIVKEPVPMKDNGFGNFTEWTTGLHDIAGFDSYKDFKTHSMILGIDICIRHAKTSRPCAPDAPDVDVPPGASVLHSDAISTLIKVVKKLIRRPISCRLPPRRVRMQRKPPSMTGLSSTLVGLDVFVDARNINVMMYNNLEPGHSLFISVSSLVGELWKRTTIQKTEGRSVKRTSRLTRRRFTITDIYSSISVPDLDMAIDRKDTGKLLTVDKIVLSDDLSDEISYVASPSRHGVSGQPISGFGNEDLDESPFYTFSATHPLQRGKPLDKVLYDKRLLVDRFRLIWSPVRRTSVFAWPDAFKEKSFCMKAPKVDLAEYIQSQEDQGAEDQIGQAPTKSSDGGLDANKSTNMSMGDVVAQLVGDHGDEIPDLDITRGKRSRSDANASTFGTDGSRIASTGSQDWQTTSGQKDHHLWSNMVGEDPSTPRHPDPLSPPLMSFSRSRVAAARRPMGSMVDLLGPYQEKRTLRDGRTRDSQEEKSSRAIEVLKTTPKFVLFINDCQVAFGSHETSGIVFLTSNAMRAGIIDKKLQRHMQLGQADERWASREYRVHLNSANLYSRSKDHGDFDFGQKNWVPLGGGRPRTLALVTKNPISMDLMYISSSSMPRENDEEEEDHILRPSLLYINVPDICLSTNADEFHAVVDVVKRVLMQSMRSSELVNEELANLRYKLQLAGGKVSSDELDDFMRRLNNVTKQFLYAGETFQQSLVDALMLPDEVSFYDMLLRYKAKAKAVATFMRQDQIASSADVLYPTMYVSYSFDNLSWELREKSKEMNKDVEYPFVEISLDDLVCRHIFYVGRGSSSEFTFGNISAQNKIKSSYFQGILQPAGPGSSLGPGASPPKRSRIKASDGAPVAFRWYSTQEDRVGGIPVYELLTIQVAPMTAAVTRKLYSSVSEFIFSARSKPGMEGSGMENAPTGPSVLSRSGSRDCLPPNADHDSRSSLVGEFGGRRSAAGQSHGSLIVRSSSETAKMDDVSQMAKRGESSMLFKYIFIDAFELTASYKNKENTARGVLDFFDLFVTTPSFSYSSQVWTWKAFSTQIRKDLVMTFARRGVSNLAKIKLLPGYSRARRRFMQGADTVRETIYSRLPTNLLEDSSKPRADETQVHDEVGHAHDTPGSDGMLEGGVHTDGNSSSEFEEEDRVAAIDAAVADISVAEGRRRETVLKALYGSAAISGRHSRSGSRQGTMSGRPRSVAGSETSGEGGDWTATGRNLFKPPIPPSHRPGTASTLSRGSRDEDIVPSQAPRASLFGRIRRKAHELKHELQQELRAAEDSQ